MKILTWLNALRRKAWKFLSGGKIVSAISHLVLVVAGSLGPAYLAYAIFGKVWAILTYFIFSEGWLLFMSGREVADYFKKKAKAQVVEDIDETWLDGWGDLAGPVLNRVVAYIGLLWLIFGR
jgi:hypothetical protein